MKPTEQNLPIRSISLEIANRSSVFAVCFCFLFAIAPHFRQLPLWISAIVLFSLCWRCLQNLGKLRDFPKWLLIPLVIAGGIGVFAQYWTVVGRDAGLALLTVMSAFKFLESRRHRDLLILVFLCYFLIATHFLFSQSIPTAVMMFVTLIVITTSLITINQREENVSVKELLHSSTRLVLLSIPLMLILFVLVPRVPGPLWGLTNEQRGGVTGLSDNMSPGKISNLIRSNEVAFRVDFRRLGATARPALLARTGDGALQRLPLVAVAEKAVAQVLPDGIEPPHQVYGYPGTKRRALVAGAGCADAVDPR